MRPRHLDRNIAVVGRIVSGTRAICRSLPRGTEALGFYKERTSRRADRQRPAGVRPAGGRPAAVRISRRPAPSFAAYLHARKNRQDDFFIRPAGGADLCNVNGAGAAGSGGLGRPGRSRVDPVAMLDDDRRRCGDACSPRPAAGPSRRRRIRPTCGRSATGSGRSRGSDSLHARDRRHDSRVRPGHASCRRSLSVGTEAIRRSFRLD